MKDEQHIDNSSSILQKIATIYADRLLSDITLQVGCQKYPAHRLILCASSDVFQVGLCVFLLVQNCLYFKCLHFILLLVLHCHCMKNQMPTIYCRDSLVVPYLNEKINFDFDLGTIFIPGNIDFFCVRPQAFGLE